MAIVTAERPESESDADWIPVYLVVDQRKHLCVVLTEPEGGAFRDRQQVRFGESLVRPLDPAVTIDTSDF